MIDSQVGGRKGKNVRTHIWVFNGIMCDVLSTRKKKTIDIQIFDYRQCFDSLWLEACLSDLYTSGVQDDKLALLYNINNHVKVAVKTPVGKTSRGDIYNVISQGDVFGPILCSNQVDTFGKECLEERKYLYTYKGEVDIPPLGMVDDLLCISECGHKTAMLNAYINFKTNSKKLQFGVKKCKQLHVGHFKDDYKCLELTVDKWTEVKISNDVSGEIELNDTFEGDHYMEKKEEEKYLGDVIATDGRNFKNIKARIAKGTGIVNKILTMLDGIPFGKHYFEVGVILRDSLLVSSMLFNSEAWYNLTNNELNLLETVDLFLLRSLLKAPIGTPKEMLYLELGCVPFRELIRERRLNFLYCILNEEKESMVNRFFQAQLKNPTKKDWVTTVKNDLGYLNMKEMTMEDIKIMKKISFMKMVKEKNRIKSFEKLTKEKQSHSKVMKIEHTLIKIQKYLQPNLMKMTREDAQLIFHLRCRVTEAKVNLKGKYDDLECGACGLVEESQQHIVECKVLNNNKLSEEIKYEKLINGAVAEKLKVAYKFRENFSKLEDKY